MSIAAQRTPDAPMTGIYTGVADLYQSSRPEYPEEAMQLVTDGIGANLESKIWVDVGAGTGKFTRPLCDHIGHRFQVFGVEPNEDMIEEASRIGAGQIIYLKSPAESLPFPRRSVAAVSAAAAAQLFDRQRYYQEVERILEPGGSIVILYNHGRFADSGFLDEYQALYEASVPGYRRGMFADRHGSFSEVHYVDELTALPTFTGIAEQVFSWTHFYDRESIEARFTSTIHFKQALKNTSREKLVQSLHSLIDKYLRSDGMIEFPFRTFVITAKKDAS